MISENVKSGEDVSLRAVEACGSPIEQSLVKAMFRIWTFDSYDEWSCTHFSNDPLTMTFSVGNSGMFDLAIQVKFTCLGERRVDFVASSLMSPHFIVELDGIEYHSSREKLISDRKKDRVAAMNGIQTIRFAGPEIAMDPEGAAREIYQITEASATRKWQMQNTLIESLSTLGRQSVQ